MSQKHLLSEIKLFLSRLPLLLKVKCCLILFQMTFLFSETVCISGDLKLLSSSLVSWCFSLFGQDVDSSGCASLSVWWGEQALFHLTLIWALKMSWVNYGPEVSLPALHEKCFRCRWWQKWGEMSPCQRVCSVFAQPLMVPVGFAECTVQSSCLLSGCHATGCWPSGWPFKARWAWERFNSGLVP